MYFARFALPLTCRSKVLSFEKTQILFGFLLTYSYLCKRKGNLARELCLMKGNQVRVLNSTCCCNPRLRGLFV